jgi:hypothetical protein
MALVKCIDPRTDADLRLYALPAEMLPRGGHHFGGYRYFKTPNIVPIEHYRLTGRAPAPIGFGIVLPFRPRRTLR